jgi:hypothetical protein
MMLFDSINPDFRRTLRFNQYVTGYSGLIKVIRALRRHVYSQLRRALSSNGISLQFRHDGSITSPAAPYGWHLI